jgi:hypothetical protein
MDMRQVCAEEEGEKMQNIKERKIDPHACVDEILINRGRYAKAKAERVYAEEYRKSLKAIIMKQSKETAVNAQEREAYSNPDYLKLLNAIQEAVEIEEQLRWLLIAAQMRVEIWRTQEASNRFLDKVTL